MEGIALVLTLFGLAWLVGAIPAIVRSWKCAPKYYNLARLLLPLVLVGTFLPRLFLPGFPANQPLMLWLLVLLLLYISGAVLLYLYREPGDYSPRPVLSHGGKLELRTPDGAVLPLVDHHLDDTVTVRSAQPQDLPGAGRIFAEVFSHTFDLSFGANRERNAALLADLLCLKISEVLVAVDERGTVVGAIWLDLADSSVPKATYERIHPITRRYLDRWNAWYFAVVGVPGMMAVRGSLAQGYVQWLGVLPQWQGHHVARKLMRHAENLARLNGKKNLALHTERANKPARQLYEHLGFSERSLFRFGPRVYYLKDLD